VSGPDQVDALPGSVRRKEQEPTLRALVVSDVHGNLAALEAVLDAEPWDEIVDADTLRDLTAILRTGTVPERLGARAPEAAA
jgi:hypothetical protein